jgi:Protein of unknown function (DUF2510)
MHLKSRLSLSDVQVVTDLLGLVFLGFFCFVIWMWADALSVPGESWTATTWTKKRWFLTWYLAGFLTMGLVPMGMAVYYYRSLRPVLRTGSATTPPGSQLSPPDRQRHGGPSNERACPWCAESIKTAARLCRFCGRDVEPLPPLQRVQQLTTQPARPPAWWRNAPTLPSPLVGTAEGWMQDPSGRHPLRWWNGTEWTRWVLDKREGTRFEDLPVPETVA